MHTRILNKETMGCRIDIVNGQKCCAYLDCGCNQTPVKFMQRHINTVADLIKCIFYHLKYQSHKIGIKVSLNSIWSIEILSRLISGLWQIG